MIKLRLERKGKQTSKIRGEGKYTIIRILMSAMMVERKRRGGRVITLVSKRKVDAVKRVSIGRGLDNQSGRGKETQTIKKTKELVKTIKMVEEESEKQTINRVGVGKLCGENCKG